METTNLQYRAPNRAIYQQQNEPPLHFVGDEYGEARIVYRVTENDLYSADDCERLCREYILAHAAGNVGIPCDTHLMLLAIQFSACPSRALFYQARRAARVCAATLTAQYDTYDHGYTSSVDAAIKHFRCRPAGDGEIQPRSGRLYRLTPAYKALPNIFSDLFGVENAENAQ